MKLKPFRCTAVGVVIVTWGRWYTQWSVTDLMLYSVFKNRSTSDKRSSSFHYQHTNSGVVINISKSRFGWKRCRRRRSKGRLIVSMAGSNPADFMEARLLFVLCCVCSVLCDDRLLSQQISNSWVCLIVCDLETSTIRRSRPEAGCCATGIRT
jgi:hypothetical protein